jgi:protein-tyrosine-phosphatase
MKKLLYVVPLDGDSVNGWEPFLHQGNRKGKGSRISLMKILFVCAANISRSFMAERILKSRLKKMMRTDVEVSSAALYDLHESAGDPPAVKLLEEKGFDGSGHQSRVLTQEMLNAADRVFVMEESHRKHILDLFPGVESKIFLLKSFSPFPDKVNADIKDCHGKSPYHLRLCFAELYDSIEGLIKCI